MLARLSLSDCSGAKVTAGFNSPSIASQLGQKSDHIKRGTEIPLHILKTIPVATLDAMTTNGRFMVLRPKANGSSAAPAARASETVVPPGPVERVVVAAEGGKFDVIEGVKINEKPLTQKQAAKLADAKS